MTERIKQIGPNRYRESYGRYYEDFVIGDVYEHRPGRTISDKRTADKPPLSSHIWEPEHRPRQ